jgi:hypothetical protein
VTQAHFADVGERAAEALDVGNPDFVFGASLCD